MSHEPAGLLSASGRIRRRFGRGCLANLERPGTAGSIRPDEERNGFAGRRGLNGTNRENAPGIGNVLDMEFYEGPQDESGSLNLPRHHVVENPVPVGAKKSLCLRLLGAPWVSWKDYMFPGGKDTLVRWSPLFLASPAVSGSEARTPDLFIPALFYVGLVLFIGPESACWYETSYGRALGRGHTGGRRGGVRSRPYSLAVSFKISASVAVWNLVRRSARKVRFPYSSGTKYSTTFKRTRSPLFTATGTGSSPMR